MERHPTRGHGRAGGGAPGAGVSVVSVHTGTVTESETAGAAARPGDARGASGHGRGRETSSSTWRTACRSYLYSLCRPLTWQHARPCRSERGFWWYRTRRCRVPARAPVLRVTSVRPRQWLSSPTLQTPRRCPRRRRQQRGQRAVVARTPRLGAAQARRGRLRSRQQVEGGAVPRLQQAACASLVPVRHEMIS